MIRRPPRSTPFPTRRSSDLWVPSEFEKPLLSRPLDEPSILELLLDRDRKRTRLNSSHGYNSYSGFFFFNDTATTEIYTFPYTTLFRSLGAQRIRKAAPLAPSRRALDPRTPARA